MWPALAVLVLLVAASEPLISWLINNYRGWSQEWDRTHG